MKFARRERQDVEVNLTPLIRQLTGVILQHFPPEV